MKKTWRVESGQHGYLPDYISDEYDTREDALNDARQYVELESALTDAAWDSFVATGSLELNAECFEEPDDFIYPHKDTSLYYVRIEEGPFDYDNTSERI